jgi:hypothetical protein
MARRRIIKSVVRNFIGTYTSRYTEYDGYWLFGMVIPHLKVLNIDLLCPSIDTTAPPAVTAAIKIAAHKFQEQMKKASLNLSYVREARLEMTSSRDLVRGTINGHMSTGHIVRFVAKVVSDDGKTYEYRTSEFVAPHNSAVERRTGRYRG